MKSTHSSWDLREPKVEQGDPIKFNEELYTVVKN